MLVVVGQLSTKEEASEVTYVAKCFAVGLRAQQLSHLYFEKERTLKQIGAIP